MHELSMDLNAVLRHAVAAGASDVHLKVGQPPVLRIDGELTPAADFGPLGDAELEAVLEQVTAAVPQRRRGLRRDAAISTSPTPSRAFRASASTASASAARSRSRFA